MPVVESVLALLLVALLVLLPGFSVQRALVPGGDPLVRLSAAAPVGLGVVWALTTVAHVLRAPITTAVLLPALAVVVLVCVVVAVRRRTTPTSAVVAPAPPLDRWDLAALIGGSAVLLLLLGVTVPGLSLAVPNDDGSVHSWMTTRIADLHTVDPRAVLSTDAYTDQPGAGFYPLALHTVAALLHQLGVPVATALNSLWLLLVAVSLPTGMFALARVTFPSWRRVPMTTALVFGVMPLLPYNALTWGGIAFVVGLSVVPAVVVLSLRAITSGASAAQSVVIGAALVGIAFTHTTEVVVVALVVACLALGDPARRPSVRWPDVGRTAAVATAVVVVVVLPWLPALRAGGAERASLDLSDKDAVETFVIWLFYLTGPLLPAMALACVLGLVVATRAGLFTGWWVLIGVCSVLIALTYLRTPGLRLLTIPWYGLPDRVAATLVYPSGLAVAVGCWWLSRALVRRLGPAPGLGDRGGRAVTTALCGGAVVGVVLGGMVVDSWQKAQTAYVGDDGPGTGASLTTPAAAAAFDELSRLVAPPGRVLNQFSDGSGWMYADARVAPLLTVKPDDVGGERQYLLDHAADVRTDPRAAAAMREWDVEYAYVRDRRFPQYQGSDVPPVLRVDALVAGGWTVVWQREDVTLLRAPAG